jgi:hypothetical protein
MPIINPGDITTNEEIPPTIRIFFENRTFSSLPELLKLMEMDYRTLSDLIEAAGARLPVRTKGKGVERPRRVFTLADVKILLATMTARGTTNAKTV